MSVIDQSIERDVQEGFYPSGHLLARIDHTAAQIGQGDFHPRDVDEPEHSGGPELAPKAAALSALMAEGGSQAVDLAPIPRVLPHRICNRRGLAKWGVGEGDRPALSSDCFSCRGAFAAV